MSFVKRPQELQYLYLIRRILKSGIKEKGRNGYTYSSLGESMKFSLENKKMPLLTTKKIAWKTCLNELLWFISGSTDNSILQKK